MFFKDHTEETLTKITPSVSKSFIIGTYLYSFIMLKLSKPPDLDSEGGSLLGLFWRFFFLGFSEIMTFAPVADLLRFSDANCLSNEIEISDF